MKTLKKAIGIVLTASLSLALLTGCGDSSGTQSSAGTSAAGNTSQTEATGQEVTAPAGDPEPFKIGMPWATASTDPTFVSMTNSIQAVIEAAGGELIFAESDFTADTLINNISELISRDVDGILFMPASDSMLPTVDAMCADAGVYWGTMLRTISDDAIREQIYASEWFAGGCNEDDRLCAANIVKKMGDIGVENLALINITKGDTSSDLRDAGAADGAAEAGINILNTTYGILDPTEMTKTIESYIASYPEMDGILVLGTYCPGALAVIEKALADHGKGGEIKVGRIDFEATMGEYLADGTFHVSYGGQQQIDPLMSMVILVNKVIGTPVVDNGPAVIITPYLELTTAQEADDYNEFFLGDIPIYTAEEIREKMIRFYNPEVSQPYLEDLLTTFSIADVVTRHK